MLLFHVAWMKLLNYIEINQNWIIFNEIANLFD